MSKLYKRATILVSRFYYHGGDGLENLGLRFFRSQEEYNQEAAKEGWGAGKSFQSSWCVKPVETEVLVNPKDLAQFLEGKPLSPEKVFFAGSNISKVHHIGGWQ